MRIWGGSEMGVFSLLHKFRSQIANNVSIERSMSRDSDRTPLAILSFPGFDLSDIAIDLSNGILVVGVIVPCRTLEFDQDDGTKGSLGVCECEGIVEYHKIRAFWA